MTKRERAQVVELLRCAADSLQSERDPGGFHSAAYSLGHEPGSRIKRAAWDAKASCPGDGGCLDDDAYLALLLEAAQRVEDCEWP